MESTIGAVHQSLDGSQPRLFAEFMASIIPSQVVQLPDARSRQKNDNENI
jgi:hypothetical protein